MPVLSKRTVDAASPRDAEYQVFDGEIPGLALRVNPSGRKVFTLFYRTLSGRKRTLTLGVLGKLTPEQARGLAKKRLAQVAQGGDPASEKQRVKQAPTLAGLVERYQEKYLAQKKESTRTRAEGLLRRVVLPALGHMKAEEVTRQDVLAFHRLHQAKPVEANRAVTLLSGIFTWAEDEGVALPQGNPCRRVKKYPERRRERVLSPQELGRVGVALRRAEGEGTERPAAILAIRLLVLTGCRKNEILRLRWEHVDFEGRCLRLPDSKTGAKTVLLGAPALELLAGAKPDGPWVCPGRRRGEPLKNPYKPWGRICKAAGVAGVRPHDLRHGYVSVGVVGGESLVLLGAIVGHSATGMTERYAHLADDPVRAAADRVSSTIASAMKGEMA
jgi:integrase